MRLTISSILSLRGSSHRRAAFTTVIAALSFILSAPLTFALPTAFGMNGGWAYVDMIKGSNPNFCSYTSCSTKVAVDTDGWPEADFTVNLADLRKNEPNQGPDQLGINEDLAGTYNVSFTGQATINQGFSAASAAITASTTYNAGTNTTTGTITVAPGSNFLQVSFQNTKRLSTDPAGTGLTNVQILRPGYALGTTSIFTTNSINAFEPTVGIQFLDPIRMTGSAEAPGDSPNDYINFCAPSVMCGPTIWTKRVLPTQPQQNVSGLAANNQAAGTNSHGAAWEYMVAFANATNKDLWINVPVSADDNYVTNLADLIKSGDTVGGVTYAGLNSGLHVYVEFSNEVWNSAYQQYTWNATQATNNGITFYQQYVNRSMEIAKIFLTEFGQTGTTGAVRPVLCWQESQPLQLYSAITTWESANSDIISNYIYGLGTAGYFGPSDPSTVNSSFDTMWSSPGYLNSSIDGSRGYFIQWEAMAVRLGVNALGYESGVSSLWGGNMADVLRDPRIGTWLRHHYVDEWAPITRGTPINYYTFSGFMNTNRFYMVVEDHDHAHGTATYTTEIMNDLQTMAGLAAPALSAGYLMPLTNTTGISFDPSQTAGSTSAPGSSLTMNTTATYLYLLRASLSGGTETYSLTLHGTAAAGAGPVDVYIGRTKVGSVQLPNTLGDSTSVSFTMQRFYHSLQLVPESGTDTFPAGTGAIKISMTSSGANTIAVVPSAPMQLGVASGNNTATLTWATTTTATSYNILRGTTSGGPYTSIGTSATTSYTDNTVTNGSYYYYVVQAVNGTGNSANSPQQSAFPAPATLLSAPAGLTVSASNGGDSTAYVALSWSPVTNAAGYNVYRSINGGAYVKQTPSGTQVDTHYTDSARNSFVPICCTPPTNAQTVSYKVTAVNYNGESAQSSAASAGPFTEVAYAAPTMSGSACTANTAGFAYIQWVPDATTTVSFNTQFNLYRGTTSGGENYTTPILSTNTHNAYDFTAVPGTTYYYTVKATNNAGTSAPSGETQCTATTAGSSGYGSGSNNVPQYPSGFPK